MQIHNVVRTTPNRKKMLIGRGGKRGKTAGRGTKGQKARAGRKIRPEMRDMIKKLPKLRGYAFASIQEKPFAVNVRSLEDKFNAGDSVSILTLADKGIIPAPKGKNIVVKILGTGELTKKLTITGCAVSASAKTKIEKAGGVVEVQ
jgi:large subunit ribosomal protein L15